MSHEIEGEKAQGKKDNGRHQTSGENNRCTNETSVC